MSIFVKQMNNNVNNFLKSLRRHAGKFQWKLTSKGMIRGYKDGKSFCPITAVCYARTGEFKSTANQTGDAASDIGFNLHCWRVVEAADYKAIRPELRNRIMIAVGLKSA